MTYQYQLVFLALAYLPMGIMATAHASTSEAAKVPAARCAWDAVYACPFCLGGGSCWQYELRLHCVKGKVLVDADGDGPETMERLQGEAKNNQKTLRVMYTKAREDDIRLTPLRAGATLGYLRRDATGHVSWQFKDWPSKAAKANLACESKAGYRRP